MKTSHLILLPIMFLILACSLLDEKNCEFDLPGTYKVKRASGYCGGLSHDFSGYFTFGNSTYNTEFEFSCDGFYDVQLDSGEYTYTKEYIGAGGGVWEFNIVFTSSNGNEWTSLSHYYCPNGSGRRELLLFNYQSPDAKIHDFTLSPR